MGLKQAGKGPDQKLVQRILDCCAEVPGLSHRKMFGGVCFMVDGHMCCGVDEDDLFVRMDRAVAPKALQRKHASVFDPTGRPMGGLVRVNGQGVKTKRALLSWLTPSLEFASKLPPKPSKAPKPTKKRRN